MFNEVKFILQLIKLNIASAMEYRASFLMQAVGMFINNGIYFVFWIIFFDQFGELRGYGIDQIFLLFAIITLGFGMALTFAGNANRIAEFVAQGRLDYYLTLPRPVLPHLLFSWMNPFTFGDLSFGVISYLFTGRFDPLSIILTFVSAILAAVIFVSAFGIVGSLAFFIGNAKEITFFVGNAMISFSLYPIGLFQGAIRLVLYTLIPAAFVGAVPVEIVETGNFELLGYLAVVAAIGITLMTVVFQTGLRRYESGSAINVNM